MVDKQTSPLSLDSKGKGKPKRDLAAIGPSLPVTIHPVVCKSFASQ